MKLRKIEYPLFCVSFFLSNTNATFTFVSMCFAVRLNVAGGECLASLRFEGNATPEAVQQYKAQLMDLLAKEGLTPLDPTEVRLAQYGAVFSLNRENEVMVRIKL